MPAIRSNIAWTCGSSRVPGAPPGAACALALTATGLALLLQLGQEADQSLELLRVLLGQVLERRHRRRRVAQRRGDRSGAELRADVGEWRAGAVVAVLADHVAGQAAGLTDDELALVERGHLRLRQPRGRCHVHL